MIVTLNFNPSVDRALRVPGFAAQDRRVYTVESVTRQPAGKGINTALCLEALGCPGVTVSFVGAQERHLFESAFEGRRQRLTVVPCGGATRQNTTIIDEAAEHDVHLREPGFEVRAADVERFGAALTQAVADAEKVAPHPIVVISGSMPPGLGPAELVNLLRPHRERVRMVVDTYGPPLAALLELHPALIAPNEVELAELSGGDVENPGQAAATARRAQQRGAREVLVRLGADGAVLLRADGSAIAAPAPRVPVTSTVGAGDASLAGFLWKQSEGPEAALVASVAAGSAACTEPTAGRLDPDLVERLRGQVDVRQVEAGKVPGGS